jgi:D-alanyl-D-alanine carboxypeptidase/D-alanyl-D-alanine-endopeptidase (penicillin-binding protein 4)
MRKYIFLFIMAALVLPMTGQVTQVEPVVGSTAESSGTVTTVTDSLSVLTTDTLPFPQNIRQRLDTLLTARILDRSQVGLMVYDLTADSVIYAYNQRQTMRPASTQKLVTAITAIDRLGGSYQLRTSLYYQGTISNGVLTGDLYLVGGMDPAFGRDDLMAFVENLREQGVDTIRGRIVSDRSMKDELLLGEGWCWDDDNPVLSPLLIGGKDELAIRLLNALRNDGAVVTDVTFAEGILPSKAQFVCARTHTLDQILTKMMKDSDNLYAESMFYQVAASGGNRPAKAVHARQHIERLIQKVGMNPADYKIADGSGLSLYNYLSPELHVRLLRYAYRDKNIFGHLLPALPIAGVDGTLKNRMKGTAAAGNVRAKTGTVTCVSCLAGYCVADNGHDLCFAIMNNGVIKVSDGRAFQDRVCRALCAPEGLSLKQAIAPVVPVVTHKTKAPKKPQKSQKSTKRKKKRR